MENQSYNLPLGFTFEPTDEQIIWYLRSKVNDLQLPFVDPIIEFDIYTVHPTQLIERRHNAGNAHLYFYVKKSGRKRGAVNGFWHANTGGTAILSREKEVIGHRRSLVYYNVINKDDDSSATDNNNNKKKKKKREKENLVKTNWVMNEYRLSSALYMSTSKVPSWTICKIGEIGRTLGADNNHHCMMIEEQQQQCHQRFNQQMNNYVLAPQCDQPWMLLPDQELEFEDAYDEYLAPQYDQPAAAITTTTSTVDYQQQQQHLRQFKQRRQCDVVGGSADYQLALAARQECDDEIMQRQQQQQQQQVLQVDDEADDDEVGAAATQTQIQSSDGDVLEEWINNWDPSLEFEHEPIQQPVQVQIDEQNQQQPQQLQIDGVPSYVCLDDYSQPHQMLLDPDHIEDEYFSEPTDQQNLFSNFTSCMEWIMERPDQLAAEEEDEDEEEPSPKRAKL